MEHKVLIVEDDGEIADLVAFHLRLAGHRPDVVGSGLRALDRLARGGYDLVVLDLGLPGALDGLELCRRLRARGDATPVVMLTARAEEGDRVAGLELGADDYVSKPFGVRELVARVNAVLRRAEAREALSPRRLARGALEIDLDGRTVRMGAREVDLTPREFDLLLHFARHPGRVYTRAELLDRVWGDGHEGYAHTVNSHINRLRAKIERNPSQPGFILTVWGVGYKFCEEAPPAPH